MRNRSETSRFVDLFASVAAEDEEVEGTEDEIDEDEDLEEADREALEPMALRLIERGNDEFDAAFEALRQRAITGGGRRDDEDGEDGVEGRGIDAFQSLVALPNVNDTHVFSLQVKAGMEQVVVLRMYSKAVEKGARHIKSVFFVPKARGRVYIEASAPVHVQQFCHHLHFVYHSSILFIPIGERVSLLAPGLPAPSIERGDLVKIRNGLYKNDIGEVVRTTGGDRKTLSVRVKSREGSQFEVKRKRGRCDPYVMDRERLLQLRIQHRKDSKQSINAKPFEFEDCGEDGFILEGKRYSKDGYRLLDVRIDRVERGRSEGATYTSLANEPHHQLKKQTKAVLKRFQSDSNEVSTNEAPENVVFPSEINLRAGDAVRIKGGESNGASGYIVKMTFPNALVRLDTRGISSRRPVDLWTNIHSLTRMFEVGDRVDVKLGVMKGRTGVVFAQEGSKLSLVDTSNSNTLEVPAAFVEDHVSSLPPGPHWQDARSDETEVQVGCPAVVSRGKHGGKSGIAIDIEGGYVRLLEDCTNLEVTVRRDNVRLGSIAPPPDLVEGNCSVVSSRGLLTPKITEPIKIGNSENEGSRSDQCPVDHIATGFEGQTVYGWKGEFKGRLGVVTRMSGKLVRLSVDSAMSRGSIVYIPGDCLVAMCGCTLSPGEELPWSKCAKGEIPLLLKRVSTPGGPAPQASIPSFGMNIVDAYPTPTSHDPTAEGMWLFADVVAKHRTRYNIVVKIEYHANAHVSGLREGRVLSDPNPLQNPLPISTPPNVNVLYMDVFQQQRVESMPVAALRPTSKMKEKGLHLIVKGERAGTLVMHLKSDGPMARVHPVGSHKSTAFHMEKSKMCIVERLETEEPV